MWQSYHCRFFEPPRWRPRHLFWATCQQAIRRRLATFLYQPEHPWYHSPQCSVRFRSLAQPDAQIDHGKDGIGGNQALQRPIFLWLQQGKVLGVDQRLGSVIGSNPVEEPGHGCGGRRYSLEVRDVSVKIMGSQAQRCTPNGHVICHHPCLWQAKETVQRGEDGLHGE